LARAQVALLFLSLPAFFFLVYYLAFGRLGALSEWLSVGLVDLDGARGRHPRSRELEGTRFKGSAALSLSRKKSVAAARLADGRASLLVILTPGFET
jgi:hypothetical protein